MTKRYKQLAGLTLVSAFAIGASVGCEEQSPAPNPGETPPAGEPTDDPGAPLPPGDGTAPGDDAGTGSSQDSYQAPLTPDN